MTEVAFAPVGNRESWSSPCLMSAWILRWAASNCSRPPAWGSSPPVARAWMVSCRIRSCSA